MRLRLSYAIVSLFLIASFAGIVPAAAAPAPPGHEEAPDAVGPEETRIIIGYEEHLPRRAEDLLAQEGGRILRIDPALRFAVAMVPTAHAEDLLEVLPLIRGVSYAKEDGRIHALFTPNDPRYADQWGPAAIGMEAAWDLARGNHTIEVGVIDTGVDYRHEDLSTNVCRLGPDFHNGDDDPYDDHYHGTHVAGTVAAKIDNGIGVAGVADVCVVPIKVLSAGGGGEWSDLASAIRWSADNRIEIISMSLGGCGGCDPGEPVTSAVAYAADQGVLMIAAAGNDWCGPVAYPAAYSEMVAVASVSEPGDTRSYFSSCGPEVEVSAPGHHIVSTVPGNAYDSLSGTSMATPHVSGVAALLWSAHPHLDADAVRCILAQNAVDLLASGPDEETGYGRVDVPAMLANPACVAKPPVAVALDALSGDGVIHLDWDRPFAWGGVDGFEVYRGPDLGNLTLLDTTDANTTTYIDPSVVVGTTYTYAVSAYNEAGSGETASITVQAATAVDAPQHFGFESGLDGWVATGLWHRTTDRNATGTHSVYFGMENGPGSGDNGYDTGGPESGTFTSPPLTVPTGNASLSFWQFADLDGPAREHPVVQVSRESDPFNFTTLWQMNGIRTYEGPGATDLSAYAGEAIHVRFLVDTIDAWSNWHEGWYLDDVAFRAEAAPQIAPIVEIVYPFAESWVGSRFWTTGIFTDGNGDDDVANVQVTLEGEAPEETYVGKHSFDMVFQVSTAGNNTLHAAVTDKSGTGGDDIRIVRADLDVPDLDVVSPAAGTLVACGVTIEGVGTDTGGSGLYYAYGRISYEWEGSEGLWHADQYFFPGAPDEGRFWLNISTVDLDPGAFNLSVRVYDRAGNMNETRLQVEKDDVACAPVITLHAPAEGTLVTGNTTVSLTVDFYENDTGWLYVEAGGRLLLSNETQGGTFDLPWDTTALKNGTYDIVILAADLDNRGWSELVRTVHVFNPLVPYVTEETFAGSVGCSVGYAVIRTADRCGDGSVHQVSAAPGLTAIRLQLDWDPDQVMGLDGLSVSLQVGVQVWHETWDGGNGTIVILVDQGLLQLSETAVRVDVRAAHNGTLPGVAYQESFDASLRFGYWGADITM